MKLGRHHFRNGYNTILLSNSSAKIYEFVTQNTFIRQNSQKVGKFAENVVLPKNQRSREHQAPGTSTHEITVEDAESQGPYARTMTVRYTPGPYKARYIPGFMIFISLIEV